MVSDQPLFQAQPQVRIIIDYQNLLLSKHAISFGIVAHAAYRAIT